MNRIEKVLQNDDSAYIYFIKLIKTFIVFISFYLFPILEKNSIYELTDIEIFINSKYFLIAFFFSISYFIITIFFIQNKIFKHNFISFIKEDLVPIFISQILIFSIYFLLNKIFIINLEYLYLLIFWLNIITSFI